MYKPSIGNLLPDGKNLLGLPQFSALPVAHYAYRYDQLNRIKSMDASLGTLSISGLIASPAVTAVPTPFYAERYAYDANWNIDSLRRYSNSAVIMDNMENSY